MKQLYKIITSNALLKIMALLISFIIWNVYIQTTMVEKTITVPVCIYNVPENRLCSAPETIDITLSGNHALMQSIENQGLLAHINAHHCTQHTNWVPIRDCDISLPHGIHMTHAFPSTIAVNMQQATT